MPVHLQPPRGDWGPLEAQREYHFAGRREEGGLAKLARVHSSWRGVVQGLMIETLSLSSRTKVDKLLATGQLEAYQAWSVSVWSRPGVKVSRSVCPAWLDWAKLNLPRSITGDPSELCH